MGHRNGARCLDCGEDFSVDHGGGFTFHLLRCDRCGKAKQIGFDKIEDLHNRYLKGLKGPYAVATMAHDKWVRENCEGEPLSEEEYHKAIEEFAGSHRCRGKYRFDAPPRCPKCRSLNIEEGETMMCYD